MSTQPVPAAQIIITIIPIVGIVMVSVLVFFFLLWRHKQIICQIKSNTYAPTKFNLLSFCLLSGILLFVIGLILSILFSIIDGIGFVLLGGLVPLGCGISLLIFFIISIRMKTSNDNANKAKEGTE